MSKRNATDDAKRPSFAALKPRSRKTSVLARATSRKGDTACECLLRKYLWRRGLRYRLHVRELAGCPDIVFVQSHIAVFVDGDFWHGRNLRERLSRLRRGHNPKYWTTKIMRNVAHDRKITATLRRAGWSVLRVWEGDVHHNVGRVAARILRVVAKRESAIQKTRADRRFH